MKHYKKSPIVEAVLCIYLEPSSPGIDASGIESVYSEISKEYPTKSPRRRYQGKLEFDSSGSCKGAEGTDLGIDGYLCKSIDEKQIVQLCMDRFVFNRLAPYEGWEPFFSEAMRLWKQYSSITPPFLIRKISLRNINKIDIPTENQHDLNKYLLLAPQVPKGISTNLKEFANETVFTLDGSTQVNLIQASRSIDLGKTSVIIDLEVSRSINRDIDNMSIIKSFDSLREAKNQVFEGCLTELIKRDFE